MKKECIHLFVYGTLRRNEKNHHYLGKGRLIAEQAWINGTLFDTGAGYPAVITSKQSSQKVYGELYEITSRQLAAIDELEGYAQDQAVSLFVRGEVVVHTDEGEQQALIYYHRQQHTLGPVIEEYDWKLFKLNKYPPKTFLYFAYGSCMDTERFTKAQVEHLFKDVVGVGVLQRYQMGYYFYAPDGNRADIIEGLGETEGIVYRLPIEAIDYLFKREGVTVGHYRPTFIHLTIDGTEYEDVLTFHVYDKKAEAAPPAFYANEILRSAEGRLSDEYVQHLKGMIEELGVVN